MSHPITDAPTDGAVQDAARPDLLRKMLDHVRHGIALFDAGHYLIVANALAEQLIGLTPGSLVPGRHLWSILEEQAAAGLYGEGEAARAGLEARRRIDRTRPGRILRHRADGTILEVVSDPTPDGGYIVTYSDVTARIKAEAQSRAQATMLRTTIESMRHGIALFGPDRRLLMANHLAGPGYGLPPMTQRIGVPFEELHREQLATFGSPEAAAHSDHDGSKPLRFQRTAPAGRVVEVSSDPIPGGGFVITYSDVTELAEARAAASAHAATLQATLDNTRYAIALFGADGRLLVMNTVFATLLQLPPEAARPGLSHDAFVDLLAAKGEFGEGEEGRALAAKMRERDRTIPHSNVRRRPNGQVIEAVSDPVPSGGFVLTYTDVSEDRRIRAELEQARNAAEAANLAKSRFLATMSHELRTPLHAVIGFSEALMPGPPAAKAQDYIASIHEAGHHLLSLIDNILDVTRAETTGLVMADYNVDVAALADSALRVIRALADSGGLILSTDVPSDLPMLWADELRLRQVLLNLLSNAVKFTPRGGTVALRARVEPDGDLCLSVSDSGIGMSDAETPLIFQPFTQIDNSLSRRFPGSGLGLYLSRVLAEAHGGSLSVSSTPGVGTTMALRLPASRLRPRPAPDADAAPLTS